ncbi:FAD-dependent oxidoreductase [Sphingomonas sp.]|uniref:FAD-dependent oxidoreductase n=1 Tax=Sphingomonas sp. TaxID=28214 RepID=UPI0031E44BB2
MTSRFAIIGAGPSGFYAAEALLKAGHHVDLFDKLPTPYGLVRYGVAPDHPKLKQVTAVFDRIAQMPGFRFFGHVEIDRDVTIAELRAAYTAVVVCCGAERDRPLEIPGEELAGVHGGLAFVGWYNGHPARHALAPELRGKNAIVIGLGNVALDVARILGKEPQALAGTDIAAHALDALYRSGIESITIAARGGPSQARCTEKELREFGSLPGCSATADRGNYDVPPSDPVPSLFAGFPSELREAGRRCHFAFGLRPIKITGMDGRVCAVRFLRGPVVGGVATTGTEEIELPADLVVTCVGSRATLVDGLALRPDGAAVRHEAGRALDQDGRVIPGLYVAGWIKRGASGTIGTNRADAVETITSLMADLPALDHVDRDIADCPINIATAISFAGWKAIDHVEVSRGSENSKPREKIISVQEMIAHAVA